MNVTELESQNTELKCANDARRQPSNTTTSSYWYIQLWSVWSSFCYAVLALGM